METGCIQAGYGWQLIFLKREGIRSAVWHTSTDNTGFAADLQARPKDSRCGQ